MRLQFIDGLKSHLEEKEMGFLQEGTGGKRTYSGATTKMFGCRGA